MMRPARGKEESRFGGVSCRNSISRAAADLGAFARPMCVFMTRQVTRDMPSMKQVETKRGRGGQAFNLCSDYMRGFCWRGDKCRFDHQGASPDSPNHRPVCKDFLNKRCTKSRYACKYRHVSQEEYDKEKAELEKNRGWNH